MRFFLAILIGVPKVGLNTQNTSNEIFLCDEQLTIQTPIGNQQSTVLISNSSEPERLPLSVALFCGSSLASIVELDNYLQCGVPVLIIEVKLFFFIII